MRTAPPMCRKLQPVTTLWVIPSSTTLPGIRDSARVGAWVGAAGEHQSVALVAVGVPQVPAWMQAEPSSPSSRW